jgi:hypothetical protein
MEEKNEIESNMDRLDMIYSKLIKEGKVNSKNFSETDDDFYNSHTHRWTENVLEYNGTDVIIARYKNRGTDAIALATGPKNFNGSGRSCATELIISGSNYECSSSFSGDGAWKDSLLLKGCAEKYFGIRRDDFEITKINDYSGSRFFEEGIWKFNEE